MAYLFKLHHFNVWDARVGRLPLCTNQLIIAWPYSGNGNLVVTARQMEQPPRSTLPLLPVPFLLCQKPYVGHRQQNAALRYLSASALYFSCDAFSIPRSPAPFRSTSRSHWTCGELAARRRARREPAAGHRTSRDDRSCWPQCRHGSPNTSSMVGL